MDGVRDFLLYLWRLERTSHSRRCSFHSDLWTTLKRTVNKNTATVTLIYVYPSNLTCGSTIECKLATRAPAQDVVINCSETSIAPFLRGDRGVVWNTNVRLLAYNHFPCNTKPNTHSSSARANWERRKVSSTETWIEIPSGQERTTLFWEGWEW